MGLGACPRLAEAEREVPQEGTGTAGCCLLASKGIGTAGCCLLALPGAELQPPLQPRCQQQHCRSKGAPAAALVFSYGAVVVGKKPTAFFFFLI